MRTMLETITATFTAVPVREREDLETLERKAAAGIAHLKRRTAERQRKNGTRTDMSVESVRDAKNTQ